MKIRGIYESGEFKSIQIKKFKLIRIINTDQVEKDANLISSYQTLNFNFENPIRSTCLLTRFFFFFFV